MTKGIERVAANLDSLQSHAPSQPQDQPSATMAPLADMQPPVSENDKIAHLATLSPIEYDRVREAEAKGMGVRVSTLDSMIKEARSETAQPGGIDFDDIQPWPKAVDAGQLLTEIAA